MPNPKPLILSGILMMLFAGIVNAQDGKRPTVVEVTADDILTANVSTYVFAIRYADLSGFDAATFDTDDVTITGPAGELDITAATVGEPTVDSIIVVYEAAAPGGAFALIDNGTYTIAINEDQVANTNGLTVPADDALATFEVRVPVPFVPLLSPANIVASVDVLTLSWGHTEGVDSYQVDVYDPYRQIYSEDILEAEACTDDRCEVDVTIDGIIGDYEVWISPRIGEEYGYWSLSGFEVVLGETRLNTEAVSVEGTTLTLTFPEVAGASYYIVDVYGPFVYTRYTPEADVCTDGVCTVQASTNRETGEFAVYIVPGVGPFIGTWTENTITVTP